MIEAVRVKIKSLAAEAAIIRDEERRIKDKMYWMMHDDPRVPTLDRKFWSLREHRKGIVRSEARAGHLAYAYLMGRSYRYAEKDAHIIPLLYRNENNSLSRDFHSTLERVARIVSKYGDREVSYEEILNWVSISCETYERKVA